MKKLHTLIADAGFVTVSVEIVKMYITDMSDSEIASTLNALYISGYLDRVANGIYAPSKNFNDTRNLK